MECNRFVGREFRDLVHASVTKKVPSCMIRFPKEFLGTSSWFQAKPPVGPVGSLDNTHDPQKLGAMAKHHVTKGVSRIRS